jgi:hypothetical protein
MRKLLFASGVTLGLTLLALIFPWQSARADAGPKPSMEFQIEYAIDPPPELVSGLMMVCADQKCANHRPFGSGYSGNSGTPDPTWLTHPPEQYYYERISCTGQSCTAYNTYDDYYRLDFTFSDGKTRVSNVFGKVNFYASYRVTVRENDLLVEELPGFGMPLNWLGALGYGIVLLVIALYAGLMIFLLRRILGKQDITQERERHGVTPDGEHVTFTEKTSPVFGRCIVAWIVSALFIFSCLLTSLVFGGRTLLTGLWTTLSVELALGLVYALWRKHPAFYLLTVILLMNMITQPILWLTLSGTFVGLSVVRTLIAEVIVWLVEGWILLKALPGRITNKEAFLLSLVLNIASFGMGYLLPF